MSIATLNPSPGDGRQGHEETWARRESLTLTQNPRPKLDYILSLQWQIEGLRLNDQVIEAVTGRIRFVPDRQIVADATALSHYLDKLRALSWPSLPDLGATVLADINDRVVPRWVEVLIDGQHLGSVYLQERQPNWDNPALLQRLRPWE